MYKRAILGLKEAQDCIQVMIKEIERKKEYYWQNGCFAVVEFDGELIAFARMDGAGKQGSTASIRKAYSAALWGMTTQKFLEVIQKRPWDESTFGPGYTVCPGGVPIYAPDTPDVHYKVPYIVGAIGVGNAGLFERDHEVAMIGAKYLTNLLWPSK